MAVPSKITTNFFVPNDLTQEEYVALSTRIAIRELILYILEYQEKMSPASIFFSPILTEELNEHRALLTAVVYSLTSDKQIRVAAQHSAEQMKKIYIAKKITRMAISAAATTAKDKMRSVRRFAIRSFRYAKTVDEMSLALDDLSYSINEMFLTPLWNGAPSSSNTQKLWENYHDKRKSTMSWSFWLGFYDSVLKGKPLDLELCRRVSLIDEREWYKGHEHLSTVISEIQTDLLAERSSLAETVAINPVTGLFRTTPIPVENPYLISALLSRVSDAVDDAVQGNNGLNENSLDVRVLKRTVDRYGNDPQRMELDFTSVAISLRHQIFISLDLPESTDNLSLLHTVEEGARGVRANHTEVSRNREALALRALHELSSEHKQQLAESAPFLEAISEGPMAEDFAADIPILVGDRTSMPTNFAPRLLSADAAQRVFGRAAKISIIARTDNAIKTLHASSGYKAVDIATKLSFVVGVGWAIWGVL